MRTQIVTGRRPSNRIRPIDDREARGGSVSPQAEGRLIDDREARGGSVSPQAEGRPIDDREARVVR
jgi:hypothetical protein